MRRGSGLKIPRRYLLSGKATPKRPAVAVASLTQGGADSYSNKNLNQLRLGFLIFNLEFELRIVKLK